MPPMSLAWIFTREFLAVSTTKQTAIGYTVKAEKTFGPVISVHFPSGGCRVSIINMFYCINCVYAASIEILNSTFYPHNYHKFR